MKTATARALAVLSLSLLALSSCSGGGTWGGEGGRYGGTGTETETGTETGTGTGSGMESESDMEAGTVSLTTAETDLGTVVVDGQGMVVYQFDQDEPGSGTSTCTGQCARNWPAVPGDGSAEVEGVTGEVGSITGVDGQSQLTLEGWPLYYYVGDQEPGDTSGQGVNDVWWVLSPAGEVIRE